MWLSLYDPRHDLFTKTLTEPIDCLVEELAYQLPPEEQYQPARMADFANHSSFKERNIFDGPFVVSTVFANSVLPLLDEIIQHFDEELSGLSPLDENVVTKADTVDNIQKRRKERSCRRRASFGGYSKRFIPKVLRTRRSYRALVLESSTGAGR